MLPFPHPPSPVPSFSLPRPFQHQHARRPDEPRAEPVAPLPHLAPRVVLPGRPRRRHGPRLRRRRLGDAQDLIIVALCGHVTLPPSPCPRPEFFPPPTI